MFANRVRILPAVLLAFVVAGTVAAAEHEGAARQVAQEWQERFNAGDAQGVAALYAPDGMLITTAPGAEFAMEDFEGDPTGEVFEGSSAVEDAIRGLREAGFDGIVIEPVEVLVIGDFALSAGTYEFARAPEGPARGQFFIVMIEQDGVWMIDRHVTTPASPQGAE